MNNTQQAEKKIFILKDRGGDVGKNWYVEVLHGTKRLAKKYEGINLSTDPDERRKAAQRLIRKLKKEEALIPANIDQKEALYQALESTRPFLEPKSYQTYASKLNQMFEWFGTREITTERLQSYFINYRESHAQTGTYDCRRQLMTYFKKAGMAHLLAPIDIKKGVYQPLSYFQPEQCVELLDYLAVQDPLLHLHCLFIYYMAIRPRKELINLRAADIFHSERKIVIRGEFAKADESLFVRIPPKFYPYLAPLKSLRMTEFLFSSARDKYKPAGSNTYGERFRKILDHLKYGSDYQLYSWKHTGCVAVYKATKNILALRDHCRHKDVTTTQKYLRQLGLDDYDDFYDNFPAPTEWC